MEPVLFQILLALRGRPRIAAGIGSALTTSDGGGPPPASLYRYLHRAVQTGWIRVAAVRTSHRPGRPGRVYELTPAGRAALRSEARRLRALAERALGRRHPSTVRDV